MRGFHNSAFDPQTLVLLEAVFDEAWLTLISVGNKTVKPDELARAVLRLAMEGERCDRVVMHSAHQVRGSYGRMCSSIDFFPDSLWRYIILA